MTTTTDPTPGEGPTVTKSVSLHEGTVGAILHRVKNPRGFSAYVEKAVQRQIEQDMLGELVAAHEAEHGPLDPARVTEAGEELMAALHGDRTGDSE
ncbi:hypothetical protein [Nocardiopsis lucentensis]|uniref:hypothetical protein n=1 Tax=Nocardiopsis lucentensis TaxID=53441 RepID=UPI0004760ACE|nr:hypothetical protein [Nocardiopsis lucentensis]